MLTIHVEIPVSLLSTTRTLTDTEVVPGMVPEDNFSFPPLPLPQTHNTSTQKWCSGIRLGSSAGLSSLPMENGMLVIYGVIITQAITCG